MKDTIRNKDDFANRFKQVRPENFSRAALEELFDFYEELEEGTGEEVEFDPIAICCDWSEMNWDEIQREYGDQFDFSECESVEDLAEVIGAETSVITVYGIGDDEDSLLVLGF